ncbi:insulinase family protein [Synechocystis sp. PCC 7339]|uniref:M16 family metallopeptidase n=1 Tax=unclassified Synechocystis TaxID=2640012 RepID=UPI001BAF96A7|nr:MULTISPECIES: pitrilysin family protein [unclassified Synechocystis]QUS61737.1 insulinase family protein [Synechocystis sp. PCC 7338]UAJ73935.1 insulinase family protein [Synechocystis sp. PCC 7339]
MRNHQSIHRLILDNGITLICTENPAADLVAGRIFLKQAGACWDSPQKVGLSHLMATVITKGTKRRSALAIAEFVECLGAHLGADAASDYWALSLKTVTADFPVILNLAAEILRYPTFDVGEIELEKRLIVQAIQSQREQPFNVAFHQLRQSMYPNHPYGYSILGSEEVVPHFTAQDLWEYHQAYFRPDNLVISLAGRLTQAQARDWVETSFGDWAIPEQSIFCPILTPLNVSPQEHLTPQATQQSVVLLGYLGVGVKHEDYAPLKLLSTYLGNGLSSRLFVELREKRGLAYDVSAFYPTRLGSSQFVTYMGTAPENTAIAIAGLRAETERLCAQALEEEEITAAKNKLLGQYALGKQTNGEIAHLFGWYETLGLGLGFDSEFQEYVKAVTATDAQRVAQTYLAEPYLSVVGPEEGLARYLGWTSETESQNSAALV